MEYKETRFRDNKSLGRFELEIEDGQAFIDYTQQGSLVSLDHTDISENLQGKGLAEVLVENTFKHLEQEGLQMVPSCSYIRVFLRRHPEWERLVAKR